MWIVCAFQAGNALLFGQILRFERAICLPLGSLVGLIALGIWAVMRVKRWHQENEAELPTSSQELLNHYEEMVEKGLMLPDELARIKAQWNQQTGAGPAQSDKPAPRRNPPTDSPP